MVSVEKTPVFATRPARRSRRISVNRRTRPAFPPTPAPVRATHTATTEPETRTFGLSPVTVAVTISATNPPYGIICANNPVNLVDPLGLWGVQFGGVNLGVGDPWMEFNKDSWGDLGRGVAADADGILTAATANGLFGLFNPNAFSRYYDKCDSDTKWSHGLGQAGLSIGALAFALPQGISRGAQQVVTHWGPEAMTELRAGDWVMTGGGSLRNWIMSGSPGRYAVGSTISRTVPASALRAPSGLEAWKALIGQRIFTP